MVNNRMNLTEYKSQSTFYVYIVRQSVSNTIIRRLVSNTFAL